MVPVMTYLIALVGVYSIVGYFAYFPLHHRVGLTRANVVADLGPITGVAERTIGYGEPVIAWELGEVFIVLAGGTLEIAESSRRARS